MSKSFLFYGLIVQARSLLTTLTGGAVLLAAIVGNALSGKRRKPPAIIAP